METKTTGQPERTDLIRGIVRSIRVSNSPEKDYRGEKDYRTVYAVGELTDLWADIEIFNKWYGEASWEGRFTIRLFYGNGAEASCVVEKECPVKLEAENSLVVYTVNFEKADLPAQVWQGGLYRLLAEMEGRIVQSAELYVMEGSGQPEEYFCLLHAGLDRVCEETEAESRQRPHSYRMFEAQGLKNIRFFLMARNLYKREWVYEFVIRVTDRKGSIKILQIARAAHFIQDREGNSILCFGVDLEEEEGMAPGEYKAVVSCFGQVVLQLEFGVGNKDIPYDFEQEVLADGGQSVVHHRIVPAYSAKEKDEIMDRLYRLVGLRKVKEEITQLMDYAEFVRLRRENGFSDSFPVVHLVFTGHPGTGKNTVAAMIGELYRVMGLLEHGKVNHYSRPDLVREGVAAEEQLVRQAVKNSEGGILFIDQAGSFFCPENPNDRGVMALGVLYTVLMREQPPVMVILADEEEEMRTLLEALPELGKLFSRRLCFEDYTPAELMEITRCKLEKLQYRFTPAAEEKFYKQLEFACRAREVDFTNGRYIDERIEEAAMRMVRRLMANRAGEYQKEELMWMTEEDIQDLPEEHPEKPLEKLQAMVGREPLKQSIGQHLNYVYFIRERQKHGFEDVMPPLNMIFSGNPGTGKMTVAKMMGEIYHAVGVLARPNVLAQDARQLALAEGGATPQQIAAMLMEAAHGGIFYLDHADVLPQSEPGLAFFEALLTYVSTEECGDTVVILGGYPDRISRMMEVNPALKSYFPYIFQFTDYSPEELLQIAENKLKEKHYIFHPKAREALQDLIQKAYENRNKNFGNVLWVEKMVALTIRNMSERTMKIRQERELTRQEMATIRKDDIPVHIFDSPKFEQDTFDEKEVRAALEELEKMVGQPRIKQQIRDFVDLARHYNQEGVKLSRRMSLQWCFTGNSAMGKGTVARIIARLYKAMGIISTARVLDFKAERMLGLTEEEAQRVIGEALAQANGGILLFDEEGPRLNEIVGFRERVKALLMNQMAERPGSYMVIYAEPKPALAALNGEAEHLSELVNILEFEDYTREELMVILKRRLQKENMRMTVTARRYMSAFIGSLVSTEERSHASSRLMRIVADLIVRNCLQRLAKGRKSGQTGEEIAVYKQDVAMFTEQFVAGLVNERKRIGFV